MTDIQIINNETVRFHKMLWHETEHLLAQCFGFRINIETGVIEADIKLTAKRSLYEFIRLSFKNFSESPLEVERRDKFYVELSEIYKALEIEVRAIMAKMLPYNDRLYIHQGDTIVQAFYKKYNFLALDRRLGKTIISASLSRLHQCKRTVIIAPATAKWNAWFRDLTKKFGFNELYFTILDAAKRYSVKAFNERFVVINYDIVAKFEHELSASNIDHFIFDECHKIKNKSAQRTRAIKALIEKFPDARITFLSGTPIRNRVDDVFSYLNLIGHELGKSYKKFCDEFTISTSGRRGTRITGGRNLSDLNIKLSNFIIRKRKEDCIDVPKQTFTSYKFELDDYKDEYNKIIEELSQQKQISALTGNLHSANIITSKAKIKGIIELAEDIIDNGEKVVIFSNYTEPIEILERHFGKSCVKITGSVPAFKRDGIVEEFKNNPDIKVFLGNMEAAGEAINLSIASEIIIVDFPLVPGTLHQAIDRCIEIGKKEDVNVNYTFCENSIDEYIYDLIIEKESDINAVIDRGKEVVARENIVELLISKLLNKDVDIDANLLENKEDTSNKENEPLEKHVHPEYGSSNGMDTNAQSANGGNNNISTEELYDKAVMEFKYGTQEPFKKVETLPDLPDFD
jgi:SWI/SNF-related matrix-associated actin-dependent regulator of chromatin subfamily A-like protein 1